MAIVTPLKTAAEQQLSQQFAAIKAELPGANAVRKLREDAFAGFEAKGLPHRRLESWRYTDLRSLLREANPLVRKPVLTQAVTDRLALQTISGTRLVTIDGIFSPAQSDMDGLPEGVSVRGLAEALIEAPDMYADALRAPEVAADDVGVMLNVALMQDGVVVEIAPGVVLDRPILLLALGSGTKEVAIFSRSLIKIGAGAKATIVELHENLGTSPYQLNHAISFSVGDGASVEHVRMATRQRPESVQVHSILAEIGADADFGVVSLVANCGTIRQQSFLRYGGEHIRAALRGISLLRRQEHSDVTLVMDHAKPHGESRELFKAVIEGEGTGVFQGKVVVRPQSQKVDGSMKSNALLLNDGATMFNKPELEIFADDVVCGHGATVAQMDGEQLFYLMARGLPRPQAEALVLTAFAGEVAEFVSDEAVREIIMREIETWLGERGATVGGAV